MELDEPFPLLHVLVEDLHDRQERACLPAPLAQEEAVVADRGGRLSPELGGDLFVRETLVGRLHHRALDVGQPGTLLAGGQQSREGTTVLSVQVVLDGAPGIVEMVTHRVDHSLLVGSPAVQALESFGPGPAQEPVLEVVDGFLF